MNDPIHPTSDADLDATEAAGVPRTSREFPMADDDLGDPALLIAIDLVEQGGMPDEAERLRELVRQITDYDRVIADAAREYVAARVAVHDLGEASRERLSRAGERLHWMVAAERSGWDPQRFVSERALE